MRNRTRLLMLVLASLVAGALGSLVAVATTSSTADACSVAAPHAEVWPSTELAPGQQIDIAGWGFYDLTFHDDGVVPPDPQPAIVDSATGDTATLPPELCDFDLTPMAGLSIVWQAEQSQRLAVVEGPEFKISVRVPDWATYGPATIEVGGTRIAVRVGPSIDPPPPPPCPLESETHSTQANWNCPDPWPCPAYTAQDAVETQPAPGLFPNRPCPEPCSVIGGDAVWCPDPCPLYAAGDPATSTRSAIAYDCPDPCSVVGGDAVWCPDPCPLYIAPNTRPAIPGHCPDPCPRYLHADDSPDAAAIAKYCPDPCPIYLQGDVAVDAEWFAKYCPDPCPIYLHSGIEADAEAQALSIYCPDPCGVAYDSTAIWCPPSKPTETGVATPVSPPPAEPPKVEPAEVEPVDVRPANTEPSEGAAPQVEATAAQSAAGMANAHDAVRLVSERAVRVVQQLIGSLFS